MIASWRPPQATGQAASSFATLLGSANRQIAFPLNGLRPPNEVLWPDLSSSQTHSMTWPDLFFSQTHSMTWP